jgi:hypothetical protein
VSSSQERAVPDASAPEVVPVSRRHVSLTGEVRVGAPLTDAFPLFTPEGERVWAPGWDPEHHHPAGGETVRGGVFTTPGDDGRTTIWVVVDWNPESCSVRYARVTPGLRAGTVAVACRAAGAEATVARVTYELAALTPEGDAELANWTELWYAGFLAEWEAQIATALAAR